jgi:YVTN family beta-propeller protein
VPVGARKRASSAIAIAADGNTLLVANPDSNSLALVDLGAPYTVTEVPVGIDPRTVAVDDGGRWAYVANWGSASISVIDLETGGVVAEIPVGKRPYGVVVSPDGKWLYVAEQGADRVSAIDTVARQAVRTFAVADRPSGLALREDGRVLYVTHLLSNQITRLVVRPYVSYLPLVATAGVGAGRYVDPSTRAPEVLSLTLSLWPESNLVQAIIVSPDGATAYVPHTRSNTANRALTFDTTVFPLVSLIDLQTGRHQIGDQIDLGTLDAPGVGLPFDAAVTPDGAELWVVNAASNDVSVIRLGPDRYRLAAHVEVGDNPRGIVLSPDGTAAYVNNTLAGTVSVLDTAGYAVSATITATEIPLPPVLLNGKRLFHSSDDPRLARAQWISCNSCHFEGEHDGRTWVFGFSGPRNTTSLLGMIETYPLRWSGEWDESADAEYVVRKESFGQGLIEGAMNCTAFPPDCLAPHSPNGGRSYDLDSLAAFMDALQVALSPAHAGGEPLSAAERRGQALFHDPALGCVTCHPPPLYTDQQSHDVGTATADERIGPAYDTPSLRGLYDSAPYYHDGSAATLHDALLRPSAGGEHDVGGILDVTEMEDLIAFLLALPFE